MKIRSYRENDAIPTLSLFRQTVKIVNSADYSVNQIKVWSGRKIDIQVWNESLLANTALVVCDDHDTIIGFADMNISGYLDRLFVSYRCQHRGCATLLIHELQRQVVVKRYYAFVSITAKSFFESQGFRVVKENTVIIEKVKFRNYLMEKRVVN